MRTEAPIVGGNVAQSVAQRPDTGPNQKDGKGRAAPRNPYKTGLNALGDTGRDEAKGISRPLP